MSEQKPRAIDARYSYFARLGRVWPDGQTAADEDKVIDEPTIESLRDTGARLRGIAWVMFFRTTIVTVVHPGSVAPSSVTGRPELISNGDDNLLVAVDGDENGPTEFVKLGDIIESGRVPDYTRSWLSPVLEMGRDFTGPIMPLMRLLKETDSKS